jgi:hypothetical protein
MTPLQGQQTAAQSIDATSNLLPQERLEIVPDGLLALAKDTRYVKECQSLFLQVLLSLFPRRSHFLLEQESWILASLLCLALGLKRTTKGTSLGMETLGLQFPSTASRWKLVTTTLVALSWAFFFSPHRNRTNNIPSTTTTTTSTSTSMSTNLAASDSTTATIIRARRDDDYQITSSGGTLQNDELLRGVTRREFHERQRRAMMERAIQAASLPSSSSTTPTAAPAVTTVPAKDETPQQGNNITRNRSEIQRSSVSLVQLRQQKRKMWMDLMASFTKKIKSMLLLLARVSDVAGNYLCVCVC